MRASTAHRPPAAASDGAPRPRQPARNRAWRRPGRELPGLGTARIQHALRETFGLDRALDITAERIDEYGKARRNAGLKPASVNRELAALRRMFTLAVQKQLLPVRPHIAMSDESASVCEGFIEPAEFEAICRHLPSYLEDAIRFGYLTAWRRGAV